MISLENQGKDHKMKEFNGTLEKFIDMGLNRPGIVFQFEVEHWETTFLAKGEVRYVIKRLQHIIGI